jgi:ribosomal RNA-processing protein 1
MADRPSYQQRLSERLARLWSDLHHSSPEIAGPRYGEAFWETLGREWPGLDRHRLDKYYLLVKSFSQVALEMIVGNTENASAIIRIMSEGPLHPDRPDMSDAIRIYVMENFFPMADDALDKRSGDASNVEGAVSMVLQLIAATRKASVLTAGRAFSEKLRKWARLTSSERERLGDLAFALGEKPDVPAKNRAILYGLKSTTQ